MINYYEILGVRDRASAGEIKKAYRQLVKVYHPDINPTPEAELKIIEITTAYEILGDPETKRTFDLQYFEGVNAGYTTQETYSEEELARKEWARQRRAAEQAEIAKNHKIKVKFYAFQRLTCYFYLVVAIVFSADYFVRLQFETYAVNLIGMSMDQGGKYRTYIQTRDKTLLETTRGVYDHYDQRRKDDIRIYYSSVFDIPAEVGVKYDGQWLTYPIFGTMLEFGNIFPYCIILICMVIIRQKYYADWALTISFIPFFLSLFLMLLVT